MTNKERQEKAAVALSAFIKDYNSLRESYKDYIDKGDRTNKETLLEFELRFNKLLGDIIPTYSRLYSIRTEHDDKHCTAFKYRKAIQLVKDEEVSLNKAGEMASGSEDYKEFLDERVL